MARPGTLAAQHRGLVVAVQVNPEGLVAGPVSRFQFVADVWFAGGGQQGGQPVLMGKDVVDDGAGLHRARPADQGGYAKAALPGGTLFPPEWL